MYRLSVDLLLWCAASLSTLGSPSVPQIRTDIGYLLKDIGAFMLVIFQDFPTTSVSMPIKKGGVPGDRSSST